mmetsp:Transcript_8963/g.12336  ORF Transcript_8963/g.12336 Transcript_8963/m.12336 type:complete len:90 (+) Transcript_8963:1164-1433(+)
MTSDPHWSFPRHWESLYCTNLSVILLSSKAKTSWIIHCLLEWNISHTLQSIFQTMFRLQGKKRVLQTYTTDSPNYQLHVYELPEFIIWV